LENDTNPARRALVWTLLLALYFADNASIAQTDRIPLDPKVKEVARAIIQHSSELAGQSDPAAAIICRRISASMIDTDAVVKFTSARIWDRMTPSQRNAYREAALRWTVRKCVEQNRDNKGEKPQVVGLREGESGDRMLAMRIEQPSHFVIWRLRGTRQLRVADIIMDGVSMTLLLRDETNSELDHNHDDIDAMIKIVGR
jgi:ABC-type transporter MlaC component